jgi:hypothetical protein
MAAMIVSLILTKPRFFAQCAKLMSLGDLLSVFFGPKGSGKDQKKPPRKSRGGLSGKQ